MRSFESTFSSSELSFRQRWNHYLALGFALLMLYVGTNLRDNALFATNLYTNAAAGIAARYPQNWLIDGDGDYIFRVRDMDQIGFKTTIQVAVRPVGNGTSARSIQDALNLNRSQTLAAYDTLTSEPFTLPDETEAVSMSYIYADTANTPFLQSVPVVVEGIDILTLKRGQAIIVTFLSDARSFAQNYPVFERFINSLEF